MPSLYEVQRDHARYYLDTLRKLEGKLLSSTEQSSVLAEVDVDWQQIEQGQKWAADFSVKDTEAAQLCASYPKIAPSVLRWRTTPTQRALWLHAAQIAIERLKQVGEPLSVYDFGLGEIREIENMTRHIAQNGGFAFILSKENSLLINKKTAVWATRVGDFAKILGYDADKHLKWGHEIDILNELSYTYRELGLYQKSIEYAQRGLKLTKKLKGEYRYATQSVCFGNLGMAYGDMGEYRKSIRCHQQSLKLAHKGNYKLSEANQLGNLAINFVDRGDYKQAKEYLARARIIHHELNAEIEESIDLGELGNVEYGLGDFTMAITYHRQALEIAERMGVKSAQSTWYNNLARDLLALGKLEEALNYEKQALQIAERHGDRLKIAESLNVMGILFRTIGDDKRASGYFHDSRQLFQSLGLKNGAKIAKHNLMKLNNASNGNNSVGDHLKHFLGRFVPNRLSRSHHQSLGEKGLALMMLADYENAIGFFMRAIVSAEESKDIANMIIWLAYLGGAFLSQARYDEAINYLELAIQLASESTETIGTALTLNFLGLTYAELGQHSQAREYHEQALRVAYLLKDLALASAVYGNIILLSIDLGEYSDAISHFQEVLETSHAIGAKLTESNQLGNLGNAYIGSGDYESAITNLEQSLKILTTMPNSRMQNYMGGYLTRGYLHSKQIHRARAIIEATRHFDDPANNHYLAALEGLVYVQLGDSVAAQAAFSRTLSLTNSLLNQSPNYFRPKYTQALALAGLGVLSSDEEQTTLLVQSEKIYKEAVRNCNAKGVIEQSLKLLEELEVGDQNQLLKSIKAYLLDQHLAHQSISG